MWCFYNTVSPSFYFPYLIPESLKHQQTGNKLSQHMNRGFLWPVTNSRGFSKRQTQCEFLTAWTQLCSRDKRSWPVLPILKRHSRQAGPRRAPPPTARLGKGFKFTWEHVRIVHSIEPCRDVGIEKRPEGAGGWGRGFLCDLHKIKTNKQTIRVFL